MKNLLIILLLAGLLMGSCTEDSENDPVNTGNIVYVTDDITSATTWYADSVYIISDYDFWVEASLTIEPGTVIKLGPGGKFIMVAEEGHIHAVGTEAEPIVFTSVKDDAFGSDDNRDGTATVPVQGDWGYISLASNANVFSYCHFHYGGDNAYKSTLDIVSDHNQVTHCVFSKNTGGKYGDFYYGALNASDAGSSTLIKNNTFYGNNLPLSVNSLIDLDNSNVFANPLDANARNTMNGIFVSDDFGITETVSWQENEVPFVIHDNDFWIEPGGVLTLGGNVTLKFTMESYLVVANPGSLSYGSGCSFTSFRDDSRGGDTNGDGTATSPTAGDWEGIYCDQAMEYYDWPVIYYDSH